MARWEVYLVSYSLMVRKLPKSSLHHNGKEDSLKLSGNRISVISSNCLQFLSYLSDLCSRVSNKTVFAGNYIMLYICIFKTKMRKILRKYYKKTVYPQIKCVFYPDTVDIWISLYSSMLLLLASAFALPKIDKMMQTLNRHLLVAVLVLIPCQRPISALPLSCQVTASLRLPSSVTCWL